MTSQISLCKIIVLEKRSWTSESLKCTLQKNLRISEFLDSRTLNFQNMCPQSSENQFWRIADFQRIGESLKWAQKNSQIAELWTPESLKCAQECDNLWTVHSRIQDSLNCRLKNPRESLNCRLKNSKEKNGPSKNLGISKKIADCQEYAKNLWIVGLKNFIQRISKFQTQGIRENLCTCRLKNLRISEKKIKNWQTEQECNKRKFSQITDSINNTTGRENLCTCRLEEIIQENNLWRTQQEFGESLNFKDSNTLQIGISSEISPHTQ
jgi:hypothetical protein